MASAVKTRTKTFCPIFGPGKDLDERVLPTFFDVMKYYINVRDELKPNVNSKEPNFNEISQIVITKVQNIWKKASIPIVTFNRANQMLKEYNKKYLSLKKSTHRKNLFERKAELFASEAKMKLFDLACCKCADFSACHCSKNEKIPCIEQAFIRDQRTVRKMVIGSIDQKTTAKLLKKEQKILKGKAVQKTTENSPRISLTSKDHKDGVEVLSDSDDDNFENSLSTYLKVTLEKELDDGASSSKETVNLTEEVPSTSNVQMRRTLSTLARECDRASVSDRAAAKIATAVLTDFKLISPNNTSNVIDRSKIRREREKFRDSLQEGKRLVLKSVYFDGRKDRTLKMEKIDGRVHKRSVVEEHLVLIEEPLSKYIGHVVPDSSTAKKCAECILHYLVDKFDLSELMALGCDGTPTNTGAKGGIIRIIESRLGRSLHWFVCQLHGNELPLRHLFQSLDGRTTGPNSFTGPIGILLQKCETLPLTKYKSIEIDIDLPSLDSKDLSTDQRYLFEIWNAVVNGVCSNELANRSPGKLNHARWLTFANRILRLYVGTENPSQNLVILAQYVVKVYAPVWFTIKKNNLCTDGAQNLWKLIKYSRFMGKEHLNVIDPVIQRNAYFAHAENILLTMVTDPRELIRELGLRRILQARKMASQETKIKVRTFEIPTINFDANDYTEMINWQRVTRTEPPTFRNIADEDLEDAIRTKRIFEIPKFPCHTQAVERGIKLVTEASSSVSGYDKRDGFIKAKLKSHILMPTFETKKEYNF